MRDMMAVDPVRKATLKALVAVVRGGAYTAQASKRNFTFSDAQQRRFALRLLNETVEKLVSIDYTISQLTDVSRAESIAEDILRLGVCQLLYMDSVPDHAAIDTSVELCRDAGLERYTKLINGVLRTCARTKGSIKPPERWRGVAEHMSVRYSWPLWMVRMFIRQYGEAQAEAMLAYKAPNHITLRANSLRGMDTMRLCEALKENGTPFTRGDVIHDAVKLMSADSVVSSQMFTSGEITIQGEGSQAVSALVAAAAGKGARVLDCCAAPGGKSAAIASLLEGEVELSCWDVHEHRVELIRNTFERLGVRANVELHDARFDNGEKYDVVLVDAPCSGLGVAYNSPDIKLQRKERELEQLSQLQARILDGAAAMVKPNGMLVYSTCTMNKDENEAVAECFIREHRDFHEPPIKKYLPRTLTAEHNTIQLLPNIHGTEGFFMAIFGRKR